MKLVVDEDGSELVAELWALRQPVASSILSYPEGCAALAAAWRAGRLGARQHGRSLDDLAAAHGEVHVLGIDEPLAHHAGELARDLGLRGYDAVHLATALALGADTTVVTWDRRLGRGAVQSGCAVAPPL